MIGVDIRTRVPLACWRHCPRNSVIWSRRCVPGRARAPSPWDGVIITSRGAWRAMCGHARAVGKVAAAATVSACSRTSKASSSRVWPVVLSVTLWVAPIVVADALTQHDLDVSPLFPRFEVPLLGMARFAVDPVVVDATRRCLRSDSSRK